MSSHTPCYEPSHLGHEEGGRPDDDVDPYATFPYADPRRRLEPSSLELALAKIMRGYLRASSDSGGDLSSLSQTSLESEPLRVRVHVRDVSTQTDSPAVRNACVSTAPLGAPRRLHQLTMETPLLSKARSLSSLSHWREDGCDRCASPSPPWNSPCGSPPARRSRAATLGQSSGLGERSGFSQNLVDCSRSLSLSQFLVRAG